MPKHKSDSEWRLHLNWIAKKFLDENAKPEDIARELTLSNFPTGGSMVKTKLTEWRVKKSQDDVQLMARRFLHHQNQNEVASFKRCGENVPASSITDYILTNPGEVASDEPLPEHLEVTIGSGLTRQDFAAPQNISIGAQKKRKLGTEPSSKLPSQTSSATTQRRTPSAQADKPVDDTSDGSSSSGDDEKPTTLSSAQKRRAIKKVYATLRKLDGKNSKFNEAVKKTKQDLLVAMEDEDKESDRERTDLGPLHWCAVVNDTKTAELLLPKADINARGGGNHTPLHVAAIVSSYEFLSLLLQQKNVDLDAVDNRGFTALMLAIYNNSPASARLLILKGADVDVGNAKEGSALHLACREPDMTEVIDDILGKTNKINTQNLLLRTPLHYAVALHEQYVMPLVKAGANLDIADETGRTALIVACFECSADLLLQLIERSNNLSAAGKDGETALHILCQRDLCEVTKSLAEKPGVNINAKQFNNGCTPLILAAVTNSPRTVEMLVEKKADMEAQNDKLDTALTLAIRGGHKEVAKILIEKNCSVDPKQRTKSQWSVKLKNDYLLENALHQPAADPAARTNSQKQQSGSTIRGSTDHNATMRVEQAVRRFAQELVGGNRMLSPSQHRSSPMNLYDHTNYLDDSLQANPSYDPFDFNVSSWSDMDIGM